MAAAVLAVVDMAHIPVEKEEHMAVVVVEEHQEPEEPTVAQVELLDLPGKTEPLP